jgi:hypothetical protein
MIPKRRFSLNQLEGFNGVCGQARTGWPWQDRQRRDVVGEPPNGVYIHLKTRCRGLALSIGADGMLIKPGS